MQKVEFNKLVEEFISSHVVKLLEVKGREYQSNGKGEDEVFANFMRVSREMDISREKVAYIFLKKHLDSIATYIRDRDAGRVVELSEGIEGRVGDAINYLLLLLGMFKEGDKNVSRDVRWDKLH
jgi:hypothetical protein